MKIKVPKDHPVRPLKRNQPAEDRATCGTCGLSWDDAIPTSMTPAPAARCPFEEFHDYANEDSAPARTRKAGRILCDYSPGETARTGLVDLLADSLHIFGVEQVRFALDAALAHYEAERTGQE